MAPRTDLKLHLWRAGEHRYKASVELVLEQLNEYIDNQSIDRSGFENALNERRGRHQSWRTALTEREAPTADEPVKVSYLTSRLRRVLPENSTIVIEAVTNALTATHHLQLTKPGSLFGTGAGGLGWIGGASTGVKLARPESFVCGIVGDGTYLFSQMESAAWVSSRYNAPFLLIVLNNGGWNAPKVSTLLVHKEGRTARSTRKDVHISFDPSPDYLKSLYGCLHK